MKSSSRVKPDVKKKEIVNEQKLSSCCGPTCCGGSDNKKLNDRKEK